MKPQENEKRHIQNIIGNSNNFLGFYRGWEMFLDSANHLSVRLIHRLPDDYLEVITEKSVKFETWTQVGFSYDGTGNAAGVTLYMDGESQQVSVVSDQLSRSILPIDEYTAKIDTLPVRLGKSIVFFS
ncbi:LamG-like jellyroll fold domain-containing protein [Algoriphagus halophilus]|uniref:LamG-like jellyroll fold domain-containing protein n=1 Tax=Algoriphagus halophilus TaxID=226505 RepID=UPI003590126A